MRTDKLLAGCGLGSRKEIKAIIKSGAVKINGKTVTDPAFQVNEKSDITEVNGVKTVYRKYIYLMLNKPRGYVSAVFDKKQPVVTELVPPQYAHFNVFPVGRLDIDTEGLLILTNDGALTHRLLAPKSHVDKEYFVRTALPVDENALDALRRGVTLDDGYVTMPAKLKTANADNECFITIQEGKFHQVKRMFEAVGNKVTYLERVKMGGLCLDPALTRGEVRELTDDETALLELKS